MKKSLLFVLFFFASVTLVQAQFILHLEKRDTELSYQFLEGETIRLKLAETGEVVSGRWIFASPESINLDGEVIALDEIRWVDISAKEEGIRALELGGKILLIAGVGYFVLDQVNFLIHSGEFYPDSQVFLISGGMLAGGLIMKGISRVLRPRKARLDKKYEVTLLSREGQF